MDVSKFTCALCKKHFGANFSLRRHVRKFHPGAPLPEDRRQKAKMTYDLYNDTFINCHICDKKLLSEKALICHQRLKHGLASSKNQRKGEKRALQFDNFTDFNRWKCQEEDATMTQFVRATGDQRRNNQTVTARMYYCNRSGRYIAKDGRLRHLKKQGTCKIGRMCPAAMFIKIFSTGGVSMSYYPEHEGHSCDIAHIRLRREQREAIAVKLAAGIPFDHVLDSIHSTATASCMTNLQSLCKQDLTNIVHEFGIHKDQVIRKNDADSRINLLISNAKLAWEYIRTEMEDNVAVAEVVCEHMSRLSSLVATLREKPETSLLPPAPSSHEPVNKLSTPQRCLRSTRKYKSKKRSLTTSKPSVEENEQARP